MSKHILVVEDDPHIRLGLVDALTGEGYHVTECRDGGEALPKIRQDQPDLVILDIMLPRRNGYEICRDLRAERNTVPILMLTAKGQETDKVIGLELGADDYVTKPFGLRELLARVHALLRRAHPAASATAATSPDHLHIGTATIDTRALRGKLGDTPFELTPREMSVLALLHQERGHVVSRDRILNEVWGIDYYGTTRTLDQVIVKIRQKLEIEPSRPRYLLTVHGLGYRLDV